MGHGGEQQTSRTGGPPAPAGPGARRASAAPLRVGTTQHLRWLAWIVGAVLVLNLLDALFTLLWVHSGLAEEGNILIQDLVDQHPVWFVVAKMALVGLGSALLWMRRHRPVAVVAIFAMFLIYYAVLVYHLGFVGALLRYG